MKELCVYTIQGMNICDAPLMILKTILGIIGLGVIVMTLIFVFVYIKSRFF